MTVLTVDDGGFGKGDPSPPSETQPYEEVDVAWDWLPVKVLITQCFDSVNEAAMTGSPGCVNLRPSRALLFQR